MASHELRTPLTALQGFSELLATRRFAPAEIARIGVIMATETERLGRIVSDFLDLARLERGLAPPLRRRRVDAAALVSDAVELLRRGTDHARVRRRAATGRCPRWTPTPTRSTASSRISCRNAVKYSPAGTPRARGGARAPRAAGGGDHHRGRGAGHRRGRPAARVRALLPRGRRPAATAGGLGLGLAVVKSLVDAHGGEIRAENVAPHGTRMTLILPAVP